MEYRNLTNEETRILERNRCRAENWSLVKVEAGLEEPKAGRMIFRAKRVKFEGRVNLGAGCVLIDSTIVNCTIGRRSEVRNTERIENYVVGDDCHIFNDGSITARPWAAMGCGTTVDVLDETGGRQVTICPEYSAQVAYMMAFYRHDPALVQRLKNLVRAWGEEHSAPQGRIGDGVTICYVTAIEDVNIGDRSQIRSAVKLENGTLGVETQVLENVSAADFILADKAVLGTSCVAKHVFLGQAASLNNSFVAHNSLIFANSVLECGETDALFAGPHTVSFHRSTLLIAAATSFFNAGSGTNQSNHYYCTGPIHHGILERGCKTGSNSYIKWPARIGQFTVIIGSHGNHPDTSSLPFSYVFGNGGETTVIPAANIRTCGVMRDVLKWRGRDKRSAECRRLDCINYEEFTPYNAERMFQGISLLERIRGGEVSLEELRYRISPGHITEGIRLYGLGLRYFFGSVLVERILSLPGCTPEDSSEGVLNDSKIGVPEKSPEGVLNDSKIGVPEKSPEGLLSDLFATVSPARTDIFPWESTEASNEVNNVKGLNDVNNVKGLNDVKGLKGLNEVNEVKGLNEVNEVKGFECPDLSPWVDMAGMIAPRPVVDELCRQIDAGKFASLREIDDAILKIHENYGAYRWLYVRERLARVFDIAPHSISDNYSSPGAAVECSAGHPEADGCRRAWLNVEDLAEIVRQWDEAAQELGAMRVADALKDFSPEMSVGFGIDHPELARADHENSLGLPDENPHVRNIRDHYALDSRRAASALSKLRG